MDVDGHVCSFEVAQAAGVVEMEVPHDDGFDVFDAVAGLLDLLVEFLVLSVVDASENIVDWRTCGAKSAEKLYRSGEESS